MHQHSPCTSLRNVVLQDKNSSNCSVSSSTVALTRYKTFREYSTITNGTMCHMQVQHTVVALGHSAYKNNQVMQKLIQKFNLPFPLRT